MSRENVEIVRRWLAAMPRPHEELQAFVDEFWDEHGDYYPVRKFPEAVPCHGREEIARFLTGYTEAWSYRHTIKDLIPVGDDRVLAYATLRAEGYESGAQIEGDLYYCYWLRHGRFFRGEDHLTPKGALRALGLRGDTLEAVGLRE
jgi:hypothetical protein